MEDKKGIVRINAGAGAGKTLVVVLRVISLLMRGIKPEEILLISFTATAAAEMKDRINIYAEDFGVDVDLSKMRIQTFNAFGNDILKEKFEEFGFPKPPTVIDNIDRSRIISDILDSHEVISGLDYRNYNMENKYVYGALPMVKKIFEVVKTNMYTAEDAAEVCRKVGKNLNITTAEKVIELYDEYDEKMREEGFIEFADQESMIFELFHRDPFYLESFGFKHIIVDEFQDSNEREINIIKLLRDTPSFESLMVVGDDSQAIFSFKDTTPDYIINFEDAMGEEVDTINLLHNYRSQANIIDFANQINDLNIHKVAKSLIATRPAGKPVIVHGCLTEDEKLEYVKEKIKEKLSEGYNPEDIAILVRNKSSIAKYADLLGKEGIPTQIGCAENVLQNCRVDAAIALFSVMEDKKNTADLLKFVNARLHGGLMEKPIEEINELAEDLQVEIETLEALDDSEQKEKIMEMLRAIDSNEDELYNHFLDNLELRATVFEMKRYIQAYAKYGEKETYRRTKVYPGVKLMTAHSSKGLEWPVVFNDIDGYENNFLRRGYETDESEEARRLFFVSSTRAREELFVVAQYIAYGPAKDRVYNRFLKEAMDLTKQSFSASSVEEQLKALKKKKKEEKKLA